MVTGYFWILSSCRRYGALLHILAFTPLQRHSRQQQEDLERQRILEDLHPDPDYDDPEPGIPSYAPAQSSTDGGLPAPNLTTLGIQGIGGETFTESLETLAPAPRDVSEIRMTAERTEQREQAGRPRRYQKRKAAHHGGAVEQSLPHYLAALQRRPVDLYDTFRHNTLRPRRSLHPRFWQLTLSCGRVQV